MPRVSIIVPSYNHGRFLAACLDSVLAQSFEDWELHLVDDGSSDDSVEIARRYAESDSRIQVRVNEKNLGTYGTQAKALELCTGEFVAILNSDDFWHPTKLQKQVEAMEGDRSLPFCYVLGWKSDFDGNIDETEDLHTDWPTAPIQDVFPHLLNENRILASGVLFRRELLRFDPFLRYSGDWVSLFRLAYRGPVACVPERLTFWRMHETNSFVLSKPQVVEEVRVRRAILANARLYKGARFKPRDVRRQLDNCSMGLIALHALTGDMLSARILSLRSLVRGLSSPPLLRRALSTFMPKTWIRRHLWAKTGVDLDAFDDPELRATLRTLQAPVLGLD